MMKLRKLNSFMRRGSGDSQVASSTLRAGMGPLEQPPATGKKRKPRKAGRATLADVTGPARIIDDDSLEVVGERIRVHRIDAPESRQICFIDGKRWQCGKDPFKRKRRSFSRPPFD